MKGRIKGRSLLALQCLVFPLFAAFAMAAVDTCVRVDPPASTNGQVLLRFSGEPDVSYFVERSTNLHDWSAELTNTSPEVVREVLLAVSESEPNSYYRVSRRPLPAWDCALTAAEGITFNGPSNKVDSFNSTNTLLSSNGQYDPIKALDSGNIYSASGTIVLTNTAVRGVVRLGSGATCMLDVSSLIGDANWAGPGIQANHAVSNFTVPFPSISAPLIAGLTPSSGIVSGVEYPYVLLGSSSNFPPIDYYSFGLSGTFIVTSNSNVRLVITGDVLMPTRFRGNCVIEPGAKLEIFMMGNSFNLRSCGIENRNNSPASFVYWGGNSNSEIRIGDGSPFHGFIFAPQAHVNFRATSTGPQVLDVTGMIMGRTITAANGVAFHLDEALLGSSGR